MMDNVQDYEFSEALAALLRPVVQAVAPSLPVVAGVDAARDAESHVLVSTATLQEVVPGTYFYEVQGTVELRLLAMGAEPVQLRALRHALVGAVHGELAGHFEAGNVALDSFGCAATVKTFYTEFAPLAVEDGFYTATLNWRAFVQF